MPSSTVGTPTYAQTCVHCGGGLQPVILDPTTPPWLCFTCKIGWWVSELLPAVRADWHGPTRSFRRPSLEGGKAAIKIEMQDAEARGTSARPEHLPLLSVSELNNLITKLEAMVPPTVTVPSPTAPNGAVAVTSSGPMADLLDQAKSVLAGKTVGA